MSRWVSYGYSRDSTMDSSEHGRRQYGATHGHDRVSLRIEPSRAVLHAPRGPMNLFLSGTVADKPISWPLEAALLTIGRSSRNAIQITDGTVSKEHAEITRDGERWT